MSAEVRKCPVCGSTLMYHFRYETDWSNAAGSEMNDESYYTGERANGTYYDAYPAIDIELIFCDADNCDYVCYIKTGKNVHLCGDKGYWLDGHSFED